MRTLSQLGDIHRHNEAAIDKVRKTARRFSRDFEALGADTSRTAAFRQERAKDLRSAALNELAVPMAEVKTRAEVVQAATRQWRSVVFVMHKLARFNDDAAIDLAMRSRLAYEFKHLLCQPFNSLSRRRRKPAISRPSGRRG